MNVPLLDLRPQLEPIRDQLLEALTECLDSTRYILGDKVEAIESAVADYCGARHAIGVSSGTDALLAALMALDIGPGARVITTPYSFFATAGAVARLGATPVFVDIASDTFNLDPLALEAWFESHPEEVRTVRAILPVHLYGQCANMDEILAIANARNIPVVEDAAQAIGASYPGKDGARKAGNIGACGCFSFFPSKNLGCLGDGGMIVTNDTALAQKLKLLRNHGMEPKYYYHLIGGNFRLDAIQAATLLVKLPHLDAWNQGRRARAARYDAAFAGTHIAPPKAAYGAQHHIYNQYVIAVPEKRDELRACLHQRGIGNEVYYPAPFHVQPCFAHLGYKKGDFPKAEHAARHTLALPVYPELRDDMQDWVIESVRGFYQ